MANCCGGNNLENITLKVEGMACEHCKKAIEKELNNLDGVDKAEVELSKGQVDVSFNPDRVTKEDLVNAITEAGYQVR
ncbi:copper chaperone CopZ [Natranaerobius thermophilus]|uniref:Copper chaperone CopZ n=1 Tax=Natranaerobius thermophilus (strain ATCC BAA-1301 / DSM 18059 / JW/NM-WN-LF) TaxID=457570 RepID=B2A161_NATTJ|nr:copper chaperone CopZ [Natranaerobius thermophilus]ACB84681.1 copper ion binding protein [Natranaerobius thermophilus JW/NM-WN-LF]